MNTSRDIEKLFDHFGGNANDYQEIGRENEAKSARTRWPLLATLDLVQPAIPEIAPRRDTQASATHARETQPSIEPTGTPALTPIHRGKPPLFARAHRRTIPPVNAHPSVDAQSAARFSALERPSADATADGASTRAEIKPQTSQAPSVAAPASALASAAAAIARANNSALSHVDGHQPARAAHSAEPAPHAPARGDARLFARREASAPKQEATPSILGKLFEQPRPAPSASASNSLNALFDRLRAGDDHDGGDTDHRSARAWESRT